MPLQGCICATYLHESSRAYQVGLTVIVEVVGMYDLQESRFRCDLACSLYLCKSNCRKYICR